MLNIQNFNKFAKHHNDHLKIASTTTHQRVSNRLNMSNFAKFANTSAPLTPREDLTQGIGDAVNQVYNENYGWNSPLTWAVDAAKGGIGWLSGNGFKNSMGKARADRVIKGTTLFGGETNSRQSLQQELGRRSMNSARNFQNQVNEADRTGSALGDTNEAYKSVGYNLAAGTLNNKNINDVNAYTKALQDNANNYQQSVQRNLAQSRNFQAMASEQLTNKAKQDFRNLDFWNQIKVGIQKFLSGMGVKIPKNWAYNNFMQKQRAEAMPYLQNQNNMNRTYNDLMARNIRGKNLNNYGTLASTFNFTPQDVDKAYQAYQGAPINEEVAQGLQQWGTGPQVAAQTPNNGTTAAG